MAMLREFWAVLSVGCAAYFAAVFTCRFVRRLRDGDRGFRSFGDWLRDMFDVATGIG